MLRRLGTYLWWKGNLFKGTNQTGGAARGQGKEKEKGPEVSEAVRKKDAVRAAAIANRRRTRGGSTAAASGGDRDRSKGKERDGKDALAGLGEIEKEAEKIADL